MNLFDQLVAEALKHQPHLSPLRTVVEKELLHHDILRVLSQEGLLAGLTFMGGTCLRSCYGGVRLSEDLDFTGGSGFSRASLSSMREVLIESLNSKYGLPIAVSEPVRDVGNVDTWKIQVETKPEQKHVPVQRIHIDICAVTSYEKRPMMLLNPYGVDMGTRGLVVQAESREEIYSDKLLAFALRPNRLKYRDLWDIAWLHQQGLKPRWELIPRKLEERNIEQKDFLSAFGGRGKLLSVDSHVELGFRQEMRRFLPKNQFDEIIEQAGLWPFLNYLIEDLGNSLRSYLLESG